MGFYRFQVIRLKPLCKKHTLHICSIYTLPRKLTAILNTIIKYNTMQSKLFFDILRKSII